MNEDALRVIVVGVPRAGKTTLALLLDRVLADAGFNVSLIPDLQEPTYPSEENLRARWNAMREMKKPIVIEMLQARKPVVGDPYERIFPTDKSHG